MIVVDASVVVQALTASTPGADPTARRIRQRLGDEVVFAPEVLDLEVAHALRRHVTSGALTAASGGHMLRSLRRMPVTRVRHGALLERVWQLRDTVTAYDAAYVALAEARGIPLLTADARLARAPGPRCEFQLVED